MFAHFLRKRILCGFFLLSVAGVGSYAAQTESVARFAQHLSSREKRAVVVEVSGPLSTLKEVTPPQEGKEATLQLAAGLGAKPPVTTERLLLFPPALAPEKTVPVFDYDVQREAAALHNLDRFLGSLTPAQWQELRTGAIQSAHLSSGQQDILHRSLVSGLNTTPDAQLEFHFRTWMMASRKSGNGTSIEVHSTFQPKPGAPIQ